MDVFSEELVFLRPLEKDFDFRIYGMPGVVLHKLIQYLLPSKKKFLQEEIPGHAKKGDIAGGEARIP